MEFGIEVKTTAENNGHFTLRFASEESRDVAIEKICLAMTDKIAYVKIKQRYIAVQHIIFFDPVEEEYEE